MSRFTLRFAPWAVLTLALGALALHADQTPAADPALTKVFPDPAAWKVAPADAAVKHEAALDVLAAPAGATLVVESQAPQAGPVEIEVYFRLRPASGGASLALHVPVGPAGPASPQVPVLSVSAAAGQAYLSHSLAGDDVKASALSGQLHLQPFSERSLAWPEDLRKILDAQLAQAPKLEGTVLRLRCVVENRQLRAWLMGHYLGQRDLTAPPSGALRLTLSPGAELAFMRSRPWTPIDPRFEPLPLEGHLNANAVAGQKIDPASLAKAAASANLEDVPFALPAPWQGKDHLDIGPSWTRFGSLAGYIAANFGTFGGRWISADRIDPSRFAMYVPPGRYKALHLIAAADDEKDSLPVISAQFYRPNAGHPFNFAVEVPELSGKSSRHAQAIDVRTSEGKKAKVFHVVMPLDPDAFSWFTDLDRIGLELTKQVHYYRAYPDPLEYSWHGGGLPSSVHVYAATLERADVDIDIKPNQFGHVWTAPAAPGYTLALRNATRQPLNVKLSIQTRSQDAKDQTQQEIEAKLPADGSALEVPLTLKPTRYGLHELVVTLRSGEETATYRRNFAFLHPDTRQRGEWEQGRGSIFGYWPWGGGHDTPTADKEIVTMAAAGAETSTANYSLSPPEIRALAEKYHFISEAAFDAGVMYVNAFLKGYGDAPEFDPANPEASGRKLVEILKQPQHKAQPSAISRPTYIPFFPEPQIGNITSGIWPSYYGQEYQLTPAEQDAFATMKAKFLAGARAIHKEWPEVKLLLPYGDPMNAAVFLRLAPETHDLIHGSALDLPGFERLPEQQINQVVLNRMYPIFKDIKQYIKDPYYVLIEGFCISSKDLDTGEQGQAEIGTRDFLVLMGYGVTRFESNNAPYDCANYWGENHYGGGWNSRLPLAMPKPAYVRYATLTRNLNRANFVKYVPTGSTSTYCQQFKHYKTGELIHVLWTLRGSRPATLAVAADEKLEVHDPNDNLVPLSAKDGKITLILGQEPVYLHGLKGDARIELGTSDHSDSKPGAYHTHLTNLGAGSWKVTGQADLEYAKNKPLQIERFPGKMSGSSVKVDKAQGGKALAIHLEKQDKDRGVMPFYTTIEPDRSIQIPGKANQLGLWVQAASDWGRVVYVVRDAQGEKWVSVGTKEEWNNDDIHGWSAFCFDGWRYMTFQLPSSLPYDSFRERGTSWWGSYGGDGVVDLPLRLEKIIVERRPQVIYGNDLVPAKPDDVLLGDLYAEYAGQDDMGDQAVKLSKIRMPAPRNAPELTNPIADLARTGVGEPTRVLKVEDPAHQYDGTRCHVIFEPVAGAKSYDVWVSPYPDGRGALALGKGWTESGQLIQGLRRDTDFYVFVTYMDKDDKVSKPSQPLKIKLQDRFGYK